MLSGKLPTGTVGDGADDTRPAPEKSGRRARTDGSSSREERIAELESEVGSLRRELDACRREKREIIDRYESLLRARERDSVDDEPEDRGLSTAVSAIESRLRRLLGQ